MFRARGGDRRGAQISTLVDASIGSICLSIEDRINFLAVDESEELAKGWVVSYESRGESSPSRVRSSTALEDE